MIVREYLPSLIGAQLTTELLEGGLQLYRIDGDPYIPFEFADAAYRYGHAQIRARHQVNARFGPLPVFPDLMGFRPVTAERTVDWTLQIDVAGHPAAQRAKRIDSRLPAALIALPTQVSGSEPGTDYASLANRDLQRGQAVGLAPGEAVARHLDVPPLTAAQLGLAEYGWTGETPLWLYILKEAEVLHAGEQLGPVGGRVVGEVLVGIIDSDPESFRSVDPPRRAPSSTGGEARYGTRSRRRAAPGEGSSRRSSSSPARGTSSQQTPSRRRSSSSSARSRRERTRSISSTTTVARSRGRAPIARLLG